VVQEVTGLHISVRHFGQPSVSTQIATLRRLLLGRGETHPYFNDVAKVIDRPCSVLLSNFSLIRAK
jgi:hypothetical protein